MQIHFRASFHMPKMSSNTKFTQLWQLRQEQNEDGEKHQEQSNQSDTHPPQHVGGDKVGKRLEMFIRRSKETLLWTEDSEKRKDLVSVTSSNTSVPHQVQFWGSTSLCHYILCWLNWCLPAFHKQSFLKRVWINLFLTSVFLLTFSFFTSFYILTI